MTTIILPPHALKKIKVDKKGNIHGEIELNLEEAKKAGLTPLDYTILKGKSDYDKGNFKSFTNAEDAISYLQADEK